MYCYCHLYQEATKVCDRCNTPICKEQNCTQELDAFLDPFNYDQTLEEIEYIARKEEIGSFDQTNKELSLLLEKAISEEKTIDYYSRSQIF